MSRAGKVAMMRLEIERRLWSGQRVVVASPSGSIEGAQWLANRGFSVPQPNHDPGDEDRT